MSADRHLCLYVSSSSVAREHCVGGGAVSCWHRWVCIRASDIPRCSCMEIHLKPPDVLVMWVGGVGDKGACGGGRLAWLPCSSSSLVPVCMKGVDLTRAGKQSPAISCLLLSVWLNNVPNNTHQGWWNALEPRGVLCTVQLGGPCFLPELVSECVYEKVCLYVRKYKFHTSLNKSAFSY